MKASDTFWGVVFTSYAFAMMYLIGLVYECI